MRQKEHSRETRRVNSRKGGERERERKSTVECLQKRGMHASPAASAAPRGMGRRYLIIIIV